MLSRRRVLTEVNKEKEEGGSKLMEYKLEKVFPVYAMGFSQLDPSLVLSGFRSGAVVGDPIWDTVREEAKLEAFKDRDPSCLSYCSALLYLKGYHSLQTYRVAHALWKKGRKVLTLALQSRISEGVTLGGTGKEIGDRHPKVGEGALIGASVTILGNIKIGEGAMIAANSLVLKDVPPHSMVAGIPAMVIGYIDEQDPSLTMKHGASKDFFEQVAVGHVEGRSAGCGVAATGKGEGRDSKYLCGRRCGVVAMGKGEGGGGDGEGERGGWVWRRGRGRGRIGAATGRPTGGDGEADGWRRGG
ncbi:hypothetical protein RJ639_008050 [Escallonia herrerae]|uniref:serine O-acetyltransferase n=1 Tax=Escallonia herrerae TaxID=1293975 RepID=A0AA89AWH3_9ASTE|nr:hypothetical protein RJ639_008050 [Escallonia herrerae]